MAQELPVGNVEPKYRGEMEGEKDKGSKSLWDEGRAFWFPSRRPCWVWSPCCLCCGLLAQVRGQAPSLGQLPDTVTSRAPTVREAEAWLQSAQPGGLGQVVMLWCPRRPLPSLPLPYSLPGRAPARLGLAGKSKSLSQSKPWKSPTTGHWLKRRVLCGEPLPRSHRFNLWWDPQTTSWAGLLQGHINPGVRCPFGHLTKTRDACARTAISSYS